MSDLQQPIDVVGVEACDEVVDLDIVRGKGAQEELVLHVRDGRKDWWKIPCVPLTHIKTLPSHRPQSPLFASFREPVDQP